MEIYELYRAGERHLADGDIARAVGELEEAAQLEPAATDIQRLLARAYFKRAALRRAETAARAVLDRNPADAETAHLLGRCLQRQGRGADATGWLRLAAAMDPRPEYLWHVEPTVTVTDDSDHFEFNIEEIQQN